jgi:hypothetical protein
MTILQNAHQEASFAPASAPAPVLAPASARRRRNARDSFEYKTIYVVTFPFFLFAAAFGRMTGASTGQERRSVFGEANELASATIPMAFMG